MAVGERGDSMSGLPRLVVVANRVPPVTPLDKSGERRAHALGGLITAVRPAIQSRDALWLGWSGTTSGEASNSEPLITQAGNLQVATVDLTRTQANRYYNGFANQTLWPLLHSFTERVQFSEANYQVYYQVNKLFAEILYPMLRPDDIVWVHDFHLFLLGQELRRLGWDNRIGFFLHVPFPPVEIFTILPWQRQLLKGLLAYDLVGLHAQRYANNLLEAFTSEMGGKVSRGVFSRGDDTVKVAAHPIGIDPSAFERWAANDELREPSRLLSNISSAHKVILGVDRLDYTKGVPERLEAFERFLEKYPSMRERVTMIQISAPSRSSVPSYVEEKARVEQLVGKINGRFATADWVPIHYFYRTYAQDELAPIFRRSDIGLVTPLRDGMNLVAKEFVAAQDEDPGVVILSRFCGAAETMVDALIVNPYDLDATATAIYDALHMPLKERLRRWKALHADIAKNTSSAWCEGFLSDLATANHKKAGVPQ